ncbi:hypothetical protein PVNG_03653 [Plasmodium vivax North Korean]|uniref:TRAP-like protein n=1 Tax=Plasmodium vivax North Korean TaxID=1035514 RepID=A0A0J9TR85_PLAVI|nr:hypothetical protein PVNG_03653 [Plasmodium vivax North Korean]
MNLLMLLSTFSLLPLAFGKSYSEKYLGLDSYSFKDYCKNMNLHILVSAESHQNERFSYLLGLRIASEAMTMKGTLNYLSYSFFDDKLLYTYRKLLDNQYDMMETLKHFQEKHKTYGITTHEHSNVFGSLKEYYEKYILNKRDMRKSKNVIIICKFFGKMEPSEYSDEFINYIRDIRSKKLGVFFFSDNSEESKKITFQISEMSNYKSSHVPLAYFFTDEIDSHNRISIKRFCYALEYGATCKRYNDWSDWSGPCDFRKRQRTMPKRITLRRNVTNKDYYTAHCRNLFNYELIIKEDYRSECASEMYSCRGICGEGYMFTPHVVNYELLEKYVPCYDLPVCSPKQKAKRRHEVYDNLLRMLNDYAWQLRREETTQRTKMNRLHESEFDEESAHPRMMREATAQLKKKTDSIIERQRSLIKNHKRLIQYVEEDDEVKIIDHLGNFAIKEKPDPDTHDVKVYGKVHSRFSAATANGKDQSGGNTVQTAKEDTAGKAGGKDKTGGVSVETAPESTANKKNVEDQSGGNTVQTANEDIAGKADGKHQDGSTHVGMEDSDTAGKTDGKKLEEGEKVGDGKGDGENAKERINQETRLNPEEAENTLDAAEKKEEKMEQKIIKANDLDKPDEIAKMDTIDTGAKEGTAEIDSPGLSNESHLPKVEAGGPSNNQPINPQENDNTKSQIGGTKNDEVNSNDYIPSENGADAESGDPKVDASQGHSSANHNNSPVHKITHDGKDGLTDKHQQELYEESDTPKREGETGGDGQGGEDEIAQVNKGVEEEAGAARTDAPKESAQKEIAQHGRVEDEARVEESANGHTNGSSNEHANGHSNEHPNQIGNDAAEAATRNDQVNGETGVTAEQGSEKGEDEVKYDAQKGSTNGEEVVGGQPQHTETKQVDLNRQVDDSQGEEHKSKSHDKLIRDFITKNHIPDGSTKQYELPEMENEKQTPTEYTAEMRGANDGRASGHNKQTHDTDGGIAASTQSHAVHQMKEKSEESDHHFVESAIPDETKTEAHHTESHIADGHVLQGERIGADKMHTEGESQHQFRGKDERERERESEQQNRNAEDANSANVFDSHVATAEDQTDDQHAKEASHASSKSISEHRSLDEGHEGKHFMRVQTGKEHLVVENNGETHKMAVESTGGEITSGDDTNRGKVPEGDENAHQASYKNIREHVGQTDMNEMHKADKNDAENIVEDGNTYDPEELEEMMKENSIISHNFGEHADAHNGEKGDVLSSEREQEEQTAGEHTQGGASSDNHAIHNQAKEEIEEERRTSNGHVAEELEADHVHTQQKVHEEAAKEHKTKDQTSAGRTELEESPKSDHLANETEGRNELTGEALPTHVTADHAVKGHHVADGIVGEHSDTVKGGEAVEGREAVEGGEAVERGDTIEGGESVKGGESVEGGEHIEVGEPKATGEHGEAAKAEGVKSEHVRGSTEEGETIKDKPIEASRESKTTEEGETSDIDQKLHEDNANPIDGTVGGGAKKEELAGASTHSAHNEKGEVTLKEHEGVNTLDGNGENEQKVEDKHEQILDYKIDDEKKASISPHAQSVVSEETAGEVKEEVEDASTANRKNEPTGEVSGRTNVNTDSIITQQKTSIFPVEESKKIESEKADVKNINKIIDNVVNTYNSKKTNSEKQNYVKEKLDVLEDFVEGTKQVEGGKNENPYKFYSDVKSVHKLFYKKNSEGQLENDKYLIVGQNNFIIDSDDTKAPFPQNMSKRVNELLDEQLQEDVMNTLSQDEKERKEATEGGKRKDGNDDAGGKGSGNEGEGGNDNAGGKGSGNGGGGGNDNSGEKGSENGSGNGNNNAGENGRKESKAHNSKTFKYGSITVFAGAVVILMSMYIYRHAQNYGRAEKDNSNNIEYQFTPEVAMNEDKGQDITCGQSGYIEEG